MRSKPETVEITRHRRQGLLRMGRAIERSPATLILAFLPALLAVPGPRVHGECAEWRERGMLTGRSFDLDGERAVTCLEDGSLRAWELERGRWREVQEIAPSSEGWRFLSPYLDGDWLLAEGYSRSEGGDISDRAVVAFEFSENGWVARDRLTPSDTSSSGGWGGLADLDGERALVVTWSEGEEVQSSWEVVVFELDGDRWRQTATIPGRVTTEFAASLDGDRLLIGDRFAGDRGGGLAWIWELSQDGWVEMAELRPRNNREHDRFGTSVSLDGDRAVIGAHRGTAWSSSPAYVFELRAGNWIETQELTGPGFFGQSVAVDGDRVLVGAPWESHSGLEFAGAAYLFELRGDDWIRCARLTESDPVRDPPRHLRFADRVHLDGNRVFIQSSGDPRRHYWFSDTPPPSRPDFRRGDANGGGLNLSDAVSVLNWLFLGEPPPACPAAGDVDATGAVNLSDPVYLLNFLFLGGPPPAAPFPDCGSGTPADYEALGCERGCAEPRDPGEERSP